jgi:hypothetical protein
MRPPARVQLWARVTKSRANARALALPDEVSRRYHADEVLPQLFQLNLLEAVGLEAVGLVDRDD